jgi:membrane protease YdiL (CAAX protease family)
VALGFAAGLVLEVFAVLLVSSVTDYATGGATGPGAAFGQVVGHVAVGQPPTYVAPMPLWLQAIVQIPLWACLLGVPLFATITKGSGPVRDLGLRVKAIDVPIGVAIGLASQFVLVPLIYWPIVQIWGDQDISGPARDLTDRATDPMSVVMLLLIVGIGAPVAEEVFFRGLTQRSAARRFGPWTALVGTAAFFAATHFEPLQFPALFAFGLILGALVWATGRLGTSIFAHLAFNLVAAITLVWNVGLQPWSTVLVGLAGLAAAGYLVTAPRLAREKPPPVTAPQ